MATTTIEVGASTSERAPARWFRGDVDGIRAIAIVLVVAYHAGLPGAHGGFIGVDVFFVISGFLISRNLLRESDTTDRVALGRFWARRVRRLVPALALVVAVTLVAGYFILPGFDLNDFAKQGGAAALYVSNVLFAVQARNYFAADISTSPFLHTWSLGVEEQFYLVWPVLFALATFGVAQWSAQRSHRRRERRRRGTLVAIFAGVFAVSMTLNVLLTRGGSTWAFFGLPSRAWEFAAAGLLAALPVPQFLRSVAARTAAAVAGLVILVVALAVIHDTTAYPGLWALLPVGATVLLIVAGETWGGEVPTAPVSGVLSLRPMQWVGRVSYSWYLWHWPAIVLTTVALDNTSVSVKSAAALATLPVAWLAYRYFETPLRFSPLIARSSPRTFVAGAVVTVLVVMLAALVWPGETTAVSATTTDVAQLEAPAGSSLEQRVNFAVDLYRRRVTCPTDAIKTSAGDDYCVGGDKGADDAVLLLGDSHAGQWRRDLEAITSERHLKLLIREHNGCPAYDVSTPAKEGGGASKVCRIGLDGDLRVISELKPRAVIIAGWSGYEDQILDANAHQPDRTEKLRIWHDAVVERLTAIKAMGIPVGVVLDEPTLPSDASKCMVSTGDSAQCAVPLDKAMAISGGLLAAERQAIGEVGGITTVDMAALVCDASLCHVELDGTLVYVDRHHFTDAFVAKQLPLMANLVDQLVAS